MRANKTPSKKISLDRFKAAAEGAYGNLTAIAKRLGVSRTTVYAFMQEGDKTGRELEDAKAAKALIEEAKESFDDIAENMIQKRILEGNDRLLEFYARTRMKHRGYSDEMNLNLNKMPVFEVKITSDNIVGGGYGGNLSNRPPR